MNLILKTVRKQFSKGMVAADIIDKVVNGSSAEDIEAIKDIPFENHEGVQLALDYYRPKNAQGTSAVIVMVHGGGLLVGDKKMSRYFCENLARAGCLVAALKYRLLEEADGLEAISDVCAGLRAVEKTAPLYGGDPNRIFVIGESAGAYLSVFSCAMSKSKILCEAMGFESARTPVKGLACLSGMFYTTKKDIIGTVYAKDLYGEKRRDTEFIQYMNPEHDEVIKNLPPVIMTTSTADFLKKYTLRYANALEEKGHDFKLLNYGEGKHLIHAFPAINPNMLESADAIKRILQWFAVDCK